MTSLKHFAFLVVCAVPFSCANNGLYSYPKLSTQKLAYRSVIIENINMRCFRRTWCLLQTERQQHLSSLNFDLHFATHACCRGGIMCAYTAGHT